MLHRLILDHQRSVLIGAGGTGVKAAVVGAGHIGRESGVQDGIAGELPSADGLVQHAVPAPSEFPSPAERQLPDRRAVQRLAHVEARRTVIRLWVRGILPIRAGGVYARYTKEAGVVGHRPRPSVIERVLQSAALVMAESRLHGIVVFDALGHGENHKTATSH